MIINHPPATLSPANFLPRLQPYPETHQAYLEHIVVKQRSPSRDLHQQLLCSLLDEIQRIIVDDGVKYHLDELQEEYKKETERIAGIKGKERETFIYFFARLAPDTPIKRLRLNWPSFYTAHPSTTSPRQSSDSKGWSVWYMRRPSSTERYKLRHHVFE